MLSPDSNGVFCSHVKSEKRPRAIGSRVKFVSGQEIQVDRCRYSFDSVILGPAGASENKNLLLGGGVSRKNSFWWHAVDICPSPSLARSVL
jgi:hypothetical protein